MLELTTPVQYVKGIGPKLAEILATKGIATVGDLLHYLPFRYEDRLNPRGIAELRAGEMASVVAEFSITPSPVGTAIGALTVIGPCVVWTKRLPEGDWSIVNPAASVAI